MKATSCEAGRGSNPHRSPDPKHGENAGGLVSHDEIVRKDPKSVLLPVSTLHIDDSVRFIHLPTASEQA